MIIYLWLLPFVLAGFFPKMLANGFLEVKNLNYIVMPKYDIDLDKLYY